MAEVGSRAAVVRQPRAPAWLRALWNRPRWAALAAVLVASLSGAVADVLMPRGPVTPAQVIVAMLVGALVGYACGLAWGSRWTMLVAPVSYMVVFELVRLGADGPTVDFEASATGLAISALSRLVHGLVSVLPMVVFAALGAGTARRLSRGPAPAKGRVGRVLRRSVAAVTVVGLAALAVAVLRPASTPAIRDAGGNPVPGSIAELTTVVLNDHEQAIMIRGDRVDNPVLMYLTGGPGGSDLALNRVYWRDLERSFVVVSWDQRGVGKSYPAFEPANTVDVDHAVADTIALAEYLRDRFDQSKIYLVGQSWGSTLGVLAAAQAPELFAAYVGVGQMVSQTETDRIIYQQRLARARQQGDAGQVAALLAQGPPPYDRVAPYLSLLAGVEQLEPYQKRPEYLAAMPGGFNGSAESEYTLVDQVNVLRGMADTFIAVYRHLTDTDLRRDVPRLDVPVWFVLGQHEISARSTLARDYFDQLQAPAKRLVVFDASGHAAHHEEPDRFATVMRQVAAAAPAV